MTGPAPNPVADLARRGARHRRPVDHRGAGGAPRRRARGVRRPRAAPRAARPSRRAAPRGWCDVRLLVVGDALLDRDVVGAVERVAPDAPVPVVEVDAPVERPGGAGLAAPLLARPRRRGHAGVAPLAATPAASGCASCSPRPASVRPTRRTARHPGDPRSARAASPSLRLDDRGPALRADSRRRRGRARAAVEAADAVLVADYGGGVDRAPRRPRGARPLGRPRAGGWDPHPRGAEPVPGVAAATPNRREAAALRRCGAPRATPRHRGRAAARALAGRGRWSRPTGRRGARHRPRRQPAAGRRPPRTRAPATRAARATASPAPSPSRSPAARVITEAVGEAVARRGVVAGRRRRRRARRARCGRRRRSPPTATSPSSSCSPGSGRQGGTVVATGGCFDVLHAGHVVVPRGGPRGSATASSSCLNSDASVAPPQGPRPPGAQRRRTAPASCSALGCVDAVVVFDEDSPHAALERLRPDVWAKGGDYAADDPARGVARALAGAAASSLLPYLAGPLHHPDHPARPVQQRESS